MPIPTWIRDALGIRKDIVDTKKAKLEITKLEDEESERRGLIDLATLDDVKKYDPKVRELEQKSEHEARRGITIITYAVFALLLLVITVAAFLGYCRSAR